MLLINAFAKAPTSPDWPAPPFPILSNTSLASEQPPLYVSWGFKVETTLEADGWYDSKRWNWESSFVRWECSSPAWEEGCNWSPWWERWTTPSITSEDPVGIGWLKTVKTMMGNYQDVIRNRLFILFCIKVLIIDWIRMQSQQTRKGLRVGTRHFWNDQIKRPSPSKFSSEACSRQASWM